MKITLKLKLISIAFLILTGLNFLFSGILWKTEISWIEFFLLNIVLAIPYYLVFYFFILKGSKKDNARIREKLQYVKETGLIGKKAKVYLSISLGYFFYVLSFSSLPFAYNFYTTDNIEKHFKTRSFGNQDEDYYSADELQSREQYTYTKVYFFHNGVYFSINMAETKGAGVLHYTIQTGSLGFDVVTDIHF